MEKWIKADEKNFPKGKCLVIYLEPSMGSFTLETSIAYFDSPSYYEDESGQGWLEWFSDRKIKVTHFMPLPEICFELIENSQKEFLNKFKNKIDLGIVPEEAIRKIV